MLEFLLFWTAVLGAYALMKHAGCFERPVLYMDPDHPLRYWWAQRVRQPG